MVLANSQNSVIADPQMLSHSLYAEKVPPLAELFIHSNDGLYIKEVGYDFLGNISF